MAESGGKVEEELLAVSIWHQNPKETTKRNYIFIDKSQSENQLNYMFQEQKCIDIIAQEFL